jgi:hypothetical protein
MKRNFFLFFLFICADLCAQKDVLCFVTSVKGDCWYGEKKKLRVGDTISYTRIRSLLFRSPGLVTFYSAQGSCRAYTKGAVKPEEHGSLLDFAMELLRLNAKTVALSSRGSCDCLVAENCLSTDASINESLLLADSISFPAKTDHRYDSAFYFIQYQTGSGLKNQRLTSKGTNIFLTTSDLEGAGQVQPFPVTLGVCHMLKGKKSYEIVSKLLVNPVDPSTLVSFYETLKVATPSAPPEEIWKTFYSDVYVFFGKPDQCRLKQLIHFND